MENSIGFQYGTRVKVARLDGSIREHVGVVIRKEYCAERGMAYIVHINGEFRRYYPTEMFECFDVPHIGDDKLRQMEWMKIRSKLGRSNREIMFVLDVLNRIARGVHKHGVNIDVRRLARVGLVDVIDGTPVVTDEYRRWFKTEAA